MWRNRRYCWKINATGGDAGDEHDGHSASADRVLKRRRKGSPINPATGGAGASDSIDCTAAYEHSPYTLADLSDHLKRFDRDRKIFDELGCCVESADTETMTEWFTELRKEWSESITPAEATRLVMRVLDKVHNNIVEFADLSGFTAHYGLPAYWEIDLPPEERIEYDIDFATLMGPAFLELGQECTHEMAQKRPRISWKQEGVEKTFLEACLQEITLHGREGSSLKLVSWKNVAERLKTEHNFIADQKQMKNRYDYIKSKFAAWSKLRNKTGNVYNPATNTFNLSEEEWQIEMKSNKHVEGLRTAPLPYPELCVQLFEGSTSNGFDSWGPSSTLPQSTQMERPSYGASEESSGQTQKRGESSSQTQKRGEKRKGKETMNSKIIEVGEHIIKVAMMLIEKHNLSNDMDACMDKLGTLGWDELDAKYQTALLLFGESADIRKVFLRLQPHICEIWVKNAGAKYGLFMTSG